MADDFAVFASAHGMSLASARALLEELRTEAGADYCYVFWTARGGAGAAGGTSRQRTLLAFREPDAALAFAQRNQLARNDDMPRLRRLALAQLIQAMLREPAISALLIADEQDEAQPLPPGQLPAGTRIERDDILRRLGAG